MDGKGKEEWQGGWVYILVVGGRKVVTADGLWRTFRGGEMDVRWDEKFELVYKYG
jgi:hypothetical protein